MRQPLAPTLYLHYKIAPPEPLEQIRSDISRIAKEHFGEVVSTQLEFEVRVEEGSLKAWISVGIVSLTAALTAGTFCSRELESMQAHLNEINVASATLREAAAQIEAIPEPIERELKIASVPDYRPDLTRVTSKLHAAQAPLESEAEVARAHLIKKELYEVRLELGALQEPIERSLGIPHSDLYRKEVRQGLVSKVSDVMARRANGRYSEEEAAERLIKLFEQINRSKQKAQLIQELTEYIHEVYGDEFFHRLEMALRSVNSHG